MATHGKIIRAGWFPLLLAGVIGVTYAPALDHMPRADQWAFLLDTLDQHGLGDTFAQTYSYNRTRQVGPGDTDLFRPLLFLLLSAEKGLFGVNLRGIQAMGLLLHFLVCYLLYLLLRRLAWGVRVPSGTRGQAESLHPLSLWPEALTLFFAVNYSIQGLVIWSHLHGYLLFIVLLLGSLHLLLGYLTRAAEPIGMEGQYPTGRGKWWLTGCWGLALLATFTYELGQLYAMGVGGLLAVFAWREGQRRRAVMHLGLFVGIFLLFQLVDRWDRWVHEGQYTPETVRALIVERLWSWDTVINAGRFVVFTTLQPFFPSAARWWYHGGRINIAEAHMRLDLYSRLEPRLLLSYLVCSALVFMSLVGLIRHLRQGQTWLKGIIILTISLYVLYGALTVLGRLNLRPGSLTQNSYYAYLALLLALLGLWMGLLGWGRSTGLFRWGSRALLGIMLFLSAASAWRVHGVAHNLRERQRDQRDLVHFVRDFLANHAAEPDFSLAFDFHHSDPLEWHHGVPFPLLFFRPWTNELDPKYVLRWEGGRGVAETMEQYRLRHGSSGGQVFPRLVQVGTFYTIYLYQGFYYGIMHWDGYFSPQRSYAYMLKDRQLAEVQRQVPLAYHRMEKDIKEGRYVSPTFGAAWVEKGYQGFNLFQVHRYYYALPEKEGPFDAARFNAGGYRLFFLSPSLKGLRERIDRYELGLPVSGR